ncbi:cation transporter, partial [Enterococcus faecium]
SRGCDNCAMLRVVRMMGRKQPYISLSKVKISKRIELDFLSQVLSFYYRIQRKSP